MISKQCILEAWLLVDVHTINNVTTFTLLIRKKSDILNMKKIIHNLS